MSFGNGFPASFDALEAAMGCLQALSKASVDEGVRNELLGKIFQSFGKVHNKAVLNGQKKMEGSIVSGDKEHAQGLPGSHSTVQTSLQQHRKENAQSHTRKSSIAHQNFQQKSSMEEVSISSLFASLSEAVSQGALDVKDFFSVVSLMEESMLRNSAKNEHAQNGILTVFQNKAYEDENTHRSVEKEKNEGLQAHASSLVLWNAAGNEDTHVHRYEQQESYSRKEESSKILEERETVFGPLDIRKPVDSRVAPQCTLVHACCSPSAAHGLQCPLPVHTSCMAAGTTKSMSNTLPQERTSSNFLDKSFSKDAANFSGILNKDNSNYGKHVTPALHPLPNDGNYPSSKATFGNSMKQPISYLEAVKGSVNTSSVDGTLHNQNNEGMNQSPRSSSHIFKIDQNVLNKRKEFCRFSILGKLTLAKGEEPWTWSKLKAKLDALWNLNSSWRLISIGKGFFQIVLTNKEEYDRVWSKEVILLNPGILRLQCWKFGFDPSVEKTTKAQVWFRIFQLPWCLWDSSVLFGIARKIGQPLKIDKQTLEGSFGHFARVLIEVDISEPIISTVLVDCNEHVIEVQVSPENMPSFCTGCNVIGHSVKECWRILRTAATSQSQVPEGRKREHKDIGMDTNVGISHYKRQAQNSEWRKKKVQGLDNGNDQPGRKNHVTVETITDFSAQGGSQSPVVKRTDVLITSNQFAVFENEMEAAEMMVDSTPFIQELERKAEEEDDRNVQSIEDDIDIPKVPARWSDLIDEEVTTVESHQPQQISSSSMEASSNLQISDKLHENCIWLNHDDDAKYDRDMCVEIERYRNSAKATRNFIANLPKKDKKVKIALRQPQGKVSSPKE